MNEVIKLLVEALRQFIPMISSRKDKKFRRRFGLDILNLYREINDAIIFGHMLLDLVDGELARLDPSAPGHREFTTHMSHVGSLARQQFGRITEAVNVIDELSHELQLVDGPVYRKLLLLIKTKSEDLLLIRMLLDRATYPVTFNGNQFWEEMAELGKRLPMDRFFGDGLPEADEPLPMELLSVKMIPLQGYLHVNEASQMNLRAVAARARTTLRELETEVDALRAALLELIPKEDLLPRAGEYGSISANRWGPRR
jgi:hypothetical protein